MVLYILGNSGCGSCGGRLLDDSNSWGLHLHFWWSLRRQWRLWWGVKGFRIPAETLASLPGHDELDSFYGFAGSLPGYEGLLNTLISLRPDKSSSLGEGRMGDVGSGEEGLSRVLVKDSSGVFKIGFVGGEAKEEE